MQSVPPVHAAGDKILPRKSQTLWVDPSPLPPIELLGAGAAAWQKNASPKPSPSATGAPQAQPAASPNAMPAPSGDESIDELQRYHAQQAQRMQMVQAAMGGGESPSLQEIFSAEGKQRLFHKVTHHPRFIPFAFVEACWFIAMFLLPFWVGSVVQWKWVARVINFVLFALYLAGALVGLPLGIFGRELEPVYRAIQLLSGFAGK